MGRFAKSTATTERSIASLRQLPILAKPALSVRVEREVKTFAKGAVLAFWDRLYSEIGRDVGGDGNEYRVSPLKTLHVIGVMSYELSAFQNKWNANCFGLVRHFGSRVSFQTPEIFS